VKTRGCGPTSARGRLRGHATATRPSDAGVATEEEEDEEPDERGEPRDDGLLLAGLLGDVVQFPGPFRMLKKIVNSFGGLLSNRLHEAMMMMMMIPPHTRTVQRTEALDNNSVATRRSARRDGRRQFYQKIIDLRLET